MIEFIALLNNSEESHIGYCGKDKEEIAKSIVQDITDITYTESFVVAYENNQLVGVLGFDADLENRSAEIWGPFIRQGNWDIALAMWKDMMAILPGEIREIDMFPNRKNIRVCNLAEELGFEKYSDETILVFRRKEKAGRDALLEELAPAHFLQMRQLHEKAFPGAYYNGQQILDRLNEHRKVFNLIDGDRLRGYIYVEAEPEFGEGSIEFFAVEENERGKGTGRKLLAGALNWLFTFESMDAITLCVRSSNERAIGLYKKVGFRHEHDLVAFTRNVG